jgi:prepilin-type N-terminal cleavage/methylation domain-containing protein
MKRHLKMQQGGFSLVEMSIVLVILAVVLSGLLPFITESMRAREQETTMERMKIIEDAMTAYALANGTLPCPANNTLAVDDANFGVASTDTADCTNGSATDANSYNNNTALGGVPTRTLAIADEYAFDGWGRRFTYKIHRNGLTGLSTAGGILVRDYANTISKLSDALYALISHGPRGHGAWTRNGVRYNPGGDSHVSERLNCSCSNAVADTTNNNRIVQDFKRDSNAVDEIFDDIVSFKTAAQVQTAVAGVAASGVGGSAAADPVFLCSDADSNGAVPACVDATTPGSGLYKGYLCFGTSMSPASWTGSNWVTASGSNCFGDVALITTR